MDFIRRILGLSSDSQAASEEDTIAISPNADRTATNPPEPVVAAPKQAADLPAEETVQQAAALADEPAAPPQNTSEGEQADNSSSEIDEPELAGTRPLPPLETIVPQPGQRLQFGQLSDVGMVRGNNQDAVFSMVSSTTSNDDLPDFGLFIVADGMGGHQEGERASAVTARMIAQHVLKEIFYPMLEQRMGDPDRPPIADVLRDAIKQANDAVTQEISDGGTTATAAVVLGDLVYIAHVGDSRGYMITDDGIEQITRDHSLVQRLIELDQLTSEEAAEHPQRNVLYKAIGQSETLEADTITRRLQPHARLLLCSDGLWNLVLEDTIHEIVLQNGPQQACNELVRLANERGGPDNITVVLVQAPG